MNRPKTIRKVYGVLRDALGDQFPSHEILMSAAKLVDIFEGRDVHSGARHGNPRPTFEELPLDEAFADGGWRVLERESIHLTEIFFDEPQDMIVRKKLKFLGMELAA